MKSWRPEGWKNRYDVTVGGDPIRAICFEPMLSLSKNAYEMGANALLEALKKEGIKVSKGQIADPIGSTYVRNGWMVFIPEEVNDGNISI